MTDLVTNKRLLYVGTYTKKEGHVDGKAEGIYLLECHENSRLKMLATVATVTNPSYLCLSADGANLYAVGETTSADGPHGSVYTFQVKADHTLSLLQTLSSGAHNPCYIAVDNSGRYVIVVNYTGSVVKLFYREKDGNLIETDAQTLEGSGPHPHQDSSHPHSAVFSSDSRYVYVPDKGSDRIWIFKLDRENNHLIPGGQGYLGLQKGSGPRHMVLHPNGKFAYVINELDNTIDALSYNKSNGEIDFLTKASTIPGVFEGKSSCADIHIHPSGKFLYGSNRGHNSISAYGIDPENGSLKFIQNIHTQGKTPRGFTIHPTGKFLLAGNQDSDTITVFQIDLQTGELTFTDHKLSVKTPVCLKFI